MRFSYAENLEVGFYLVRFEAFRLILNAIAAKRAYVVVLAEPARED